jgi:predicted GH43/DUF377 family glycosyl hydrolase
MFNLERLGVLLEKTSLPFENKAVLNPTVFQEGSKTHMFYRAVANTGISSIGYCLIDRDKLIERSNKPILVPEYDYEKKGIEDPRLTKINGTYYMFYVGYDGLNARVCYATSKDLKNFTKQGIISPNISSEEAEKYMRKTKIKDSYYFFTHRHDGIGKIWDKDAFLMPEKFNGKYALVHRILPEIQIAFFDNFEQLKSDDFWKDYLANISKYVLIENTEWFETRNIGAGCPAIETTAGWLMIYHGVHQTNKKRVYSIGAALLDKNNPLDLIGKTKDPILVPEEEYELSGDVHNTIFPTGAAIYDNDLYIYYGAADERIGVAKAELDNLLRDVIKYGIKRI